MKKTIKILLLLIMSFSVLFIYKATKNSKIQILNIGDGLSQGINSYGIKDISYVDYYKDFLKNKNDNVLVNNAYSTKLQTIDNVLQLINNTPQIKRDLIDSHILILTLGYNDLIYRFSLEDKMNSDKANEIIKEITHEFNELINQIQKYYRNEIIVVGYYKTNRDDYYLNMSIKRLNNYFANNEKITYIDTYNTLNNKKYFLNPNSYYPNLEGYRKISEKIINKTLEK